MGKLSNGWTDWHQLWFTSADSSGNGHRLNTIRPIMPQWAFQGGGRGSHIKVWESCQTTGPIDTQFGTRLWIHLRRIIFIIIIIIIRQRLCPVVGRRHQHAVSTLPCIELSSTISNCFSLSKTIRLTIPQGVMLVGIRGQQFKILENVVKRLDRLGINVTHIMQMYLGMDKM